MRNQHQIDLRLMIKKVADRDASIHKLKGERFQWEKVKLKCEDDLRELLKDYALQQQECTKANQKIVRMREQRAGLTEQNNSLQEHNIALKKLYEELEKKYRETFDEKRSEYVGMKQRVRNVERENSTLKGQIRDVEDAYSELKIELSTIEDEKLELRDELSTSSKKYENLLLINNNNHDYLVENQQLRSRIAEIEAWFDEAWAGFRLEVNNKHID